MLERKTFHQPQTDESSDCELIQAIGQGDEQAFRSLYKRWSGRLLSFLSRTTGSVETAEELLQEAFIRILKAAPRYRPTGKASAWIYRICANLSYSYWRRELRSPLQPNSGKTAGIVAKASIASNPAQLMLRREFSLALERALRELSANHRLVFILKADHSLTYEEIARILQCPEGTVKSRFHYCVRRLRNELQEWEAGFPQENTDAETNRLSSKETMK